MLTRHIVTLREETADDLKEDYFIPVLWIHLEELIVAFEFENQACRLMKRVDGCHYYFTLHWIASNLGLWAFSIARGLR